MILKKRARKTTIPALLASAVIGAAGVARAGWMDWLQSLGSNQDTGHNATSVAAVRGLDDFDPNNAARDTQSIDKLDRLAINGEDVDAFVREGHLAN